MRRALSIAFLTASLAPCFALDRFDIHPQWELVKCVSFNRGDATDLSWVAQAPTLVGGASFSAGKIDLDGAGDGFRYPDHDAISFNVSGQDQPFTIAVWVYLNATSACDFAFKGSAGSFEYQFGIGATARAYCGLYNPAATVYIDRRGSTALSTAAWYHMVVTYSGSEVNTGINQYLNGALDNGAAGGAGSYTGMTNGTGTLSCGINNSGTNAMNGSFRSLHFFSRELSAAEVGALYAEGVR